MRRNNLSTLAALGLALVLLGATALAQAQAQAPEGAPKQATAKAPEKKAEEKPASAAEPPLVRTDLLKAVSGEHVIPLRDIFRPKFVAVPQAPARQPGRPAAGPAAKTAEAAPAFTLTLSYLGPVSGGGKTLALVTVNGQTLPVGVGDEVAPGYKVLRITTDAIVVEGPNAETKTFTR